MKNLSKKSNAKNNQSFKGFSKFQLNAVQLKTIKGGNGSGGNDDDGGLITDDIIEG